MRSLRELGEDFRLPEVIGADKSMSLQEAVRQYVRPGMTLHLPMSGARPSAAVTELVRQFDGSDPGFVLSGQGIVNTQHALVHRGLVRRLITSYAGENYPAPGPNRALQAAVRAGRVEIENWSLWSLTARLIAGAQGVPFFPVRSLAGSSMGDDLAGVHYETVAAFGHEVGAVAPLRPDVVLLPAVAADRQGNAILSAPIGEGAWGALAATSGAIVCAEEITDLARLREHNSLVHVPAHAVLAVCHTPFGSHPYGMSNPGILGVRSYVEDLDFIQDVRRTSRSHEDFDAWIERWMLGLEGHDAYLDQLGEERLSRLVGRSHPLTWQFEAAPDRAEPDPATDEEAMVLRAARVVTERLADGSFDVVLAGVGYAHLASWLAVDEVARHGSEVRLLAEIGMVGYAPRPGEPFLFANRNLPTCTQLTDIADVLGTFVAGPSGRCLGVLGAGQVDSAGRINSTWTADGTFLTGSGGANDVATAAEEVVVTVKHSPGRLVDEVPYVTAPGHQVSTVVTSEAIYERREGTLMLTQYVSRSGESDHETLARIAAGAGWTVPVADDVRPEPLTSSAQLARLRAFDPRGVFIGR